MQRVVDRLPLFQPILFPPENLQPRVLLEPLAMYMGVSSSEGWRVRQTIMDASHSICRLHHGQTVHEGGSIRIAVKAPPP